jgi:hypothetical protein
VLDVYFTVDVEVWSNRWTDIDENFSKYFRRYVYGPTDRGDYALPFILALLKEHGLAGVFFVESLFSARCGKAPLEELLSLIREANQEVQLHAHTEWIDEALTPILANPGRKRRQLSRYTLQEQVLIVAAAKRLLQDAGGGSPAAFRAGSFGLDHNTLSAVLSNGISIDSSYDASVSRASFRGPPILDNAMIDGVDEVPMTVFRDGLGRLRHAQLGACTFEELEHALWQSVELGRRSFVLLTHNFEMLSKHKSQPNDIIVDRTRKLCRFLDRNRDAFRVRGFADKVAPAASVPPVELQSTLLLTGQRMIHQFQSRMY